MSNGTNWIELAKMAQGNFQNRRALEWKLAFGFWGAIGTFTGALMTIKGLNRPDHLGCLLAIAYTIVFLVVVVFWQYPLHSAHAGDHAWWRYYMWKAAGDEKKEPELKKWYLAWSGWQWTNWFWFIGQCAFTAVFLAISWFAITRVAPL